MTEDISQESRDGAESEHGDKKDRREVCTRCQSREQSLPGGPERSPA